MPRISLQPPRTLRYRLVEWWSRRRFGAVADPAAAMGHNMPVLLADARFETSVATWHRLDPALKHLAALVELTMMVAVENQRSRFNSALGLTSQGFRHRCEVPVTPLRPAGTGAA